MVLGMLYFLGYVMIGAAVGQVRIAVNQRSLAMAAKELLRVEALNGSDNRVVINVYSFWAGKSEIDYAVVRFTDGTVRTYDFQLSVGAYSAVLLRPSQIDPSLPDDPRAFRDRVAGISFHTKLGNVFGTSEEIRRESTTQSYTTQTVTRQVTITQTVFG